MIRAIIFDLDDTLYDELQFVKGGFKAVALFISKENNLNQNEVYELLLDILQQYGRGKTFNIALKKLGLDNDKIIPELVNIYRKHKPNLILYPNTKEILSILRKMGYKIGLITDGNEEVQKSKVRALKINEFFDSMVFSNEYGVDKQKPNPFVYKKILKDLEVDARNSIYIGDNPSKDFITAKKLGMFTIRILKGQHKDKKIDENYEANYEIKELKDLIELVVNLK